MAYKYPICDVFHWFCKIARFFATESLYALPEPFFYRLWDKWRASQKSKQFYNWV